MRALHPSRVLAEFGAAFRTLIVSVINDSRQMSVLIVELPTEQKGTGVSARGRSCKRRSRGCRAAQTGIRHSERSTHPGNLHRHLPPVRSLSITRVESQRNRSSIPSCCTRGFENRTTCLFTRRRCLSSASLSPRRRHKIPTFRAGCNADWMKYAGWVNGLGLGWHAWCTPMEVLRSTGNTT